jgi:hypothetical protein
MHDLAATRLRTTTTLSPEQRARLQRDGRIARALEAAQRRTGSRFSRIVPEPSGIARRGGRGGA